MLGTLRRAGEVLDLFTPDQPEWGVTEAATRLGIPKSKAHHMLSSLVEIGLLQRGAHGSYRLGWRTVSLASTVLRTASLTTLAGPVMRELASAVKGTVHLVAQDQLRLVCLERRHAPGGAPPLAPSVGMAVPFDTAPTALVVLAYCDRATVHALWAGGGLRTGHGSIEALDRDRLEVRAQGWHRDDQQGSGEPIRIAAPVREGTGAVVAALGVTVPQGAAVASGTARVVAAARELSARLQPPAVRDERRLASGRYASPRRHAQARVTAS